MLIKLKPGSLDRVREWAQTLSERRDEALATLTTPATHKRMMILATFVVIDAAIARIPWLPGTVRGPEIRSAVLAHYDLTHLYQLAMLAPVLIYETIRFRHVHWTYLFGVGLFLAFALSAHFAWDSLAWHEMVVRLLEA